MPARLLVRHADGKVEERDPEDLSELRDRPCWLDVSDPNDTDLDLAKELSLHPLALEDARHRHQRPKIDQYEGHYFLIEILKACGHRRLGRRTGVVLPPAGSAVVRSARGG